MHHSRKSIILILTVFSLIFAFSCPSAKADDQPVGDSFFPLFSAKIGYQLTHLYYSEENMDEKGYLNGVHAELTFHPGRTMIRIDGDYSGGNVDYDGQTWSGASLKTSGDDYLLNLRALLGFDLISEKNALTPYLGIAVRYWKDEQKSSSSYKRETWYYYSPVGLLYTYNSGSAFSFALQAEYDFFWQGKNKSALSDVNPGLNNVEMKQTQGYGVFISASFTYDFGMVGINLEPFFQYWDIKESDSDNLYYYGQFMTTVVEPDNDTKIWGVRVSAEF